MPARRTAWWRSLASGPNPRRRSRPAWPDFARYAGLFRLGDLLPLAESLAARWRSLPGILRLEVAGPVRRRLEVAGAIDLAVATDHPHQVLAKLEKVLGAEFVASHPWSGRNHPAPGGAPQADPGRRLRGSGPPGW